MTSHTNTDNIYIHILNIKNRDSSSFTEACLTYMSEFVMDEYEFSKLVKKNTNIVEALKLEAYNNNMMCEKDKQNRLI